MFRIFASFSIFKWEAISTVQSFLIQSLLYSILPEFVSPQLILGYADVCEHRLPQKKKSKIGRKSDILVVLLVDQLLTIVLLIKLHKKRTVQSLITLYWVLIFTFTISIRSDLWNRLDFVIVVTYVVTFILRMFTWATSVAVANNRPLAVAGCLYGFITMFLALRTFGHVMECTRGMGPTQIALFFIIWDVLVIFWQFVATIVAFSLVITKIFVSEKYYLSNGKTHGSL